MLWGWSFSFINTLLKNWFDLEIRASSSPKARWVFYFLQDHRLCIFSLIFYHSKGFVVGFCGSKIFCLHVYNMSSVEVPQVNITRSRCFQWNSLFFLSYLCDNSKLKLKFFLGDEIILKMLRYLIIDWVSKSNLLSTFLFSQHLCTNIWKRKCFSKFIKALKIE